MIDFNDLYDREIKNLFNFGMKFSPDREMVKDCIQDVFVKLYTKRDIMEKVDNIESYLYISLRNRINDEFRRNAHVQDCEIDNDQFITDLIVDNDHLERDEEFSKKKVCTMKMMECLSPRQRQIVELYFIKRQKYEEICEIMGINYQSVRNLMYRSLMRMRTNAIKFNIAY